MYNHLHRLVVSHAGDRFVDAHLSFTFILLSFSVTRHALCQRALHCAYVPKCRSLYTNEHPPAYFAPALRSATTTAV